MFHLVHLELNYIEYIDLNLCSIVASSALHNAITVKINSSGSGLF